MAPKAHSKAAHRESSYRKVGRSASASPTAERKARPKRPSSGVRQSSSSVNASHSSHSSRVLSDSVQTDWLVHVQKIRSLGVLPWTEAVDDSSRSPLERIAEAECLATFKRFDTNGDGTIDLNAWKQLMQFLDFNDDDHSAAMLFQTLKTGGTSSVCYKELLQWIFSKGTHQQNFLEALRTDRPVQVLPDLWMGTVRQARDEALMQTLGITAILNAAGREEPMKDHPFGTAYIEIFPEDHCEYLLLSEHWEPVQEFLKRCRCKKATTLVCSLNGMNRSAALVVAWLMAANEWTLSKAVHHVHCVRVGSLFNAGFQRELVVLAHTKGLLREEEFVRAEIEREENRLRMLFLMFLPNSSGCLAAGNFRSVLKSPPAYGRFIVGLSEAEIDSHWEHLQWYSQEEGPAAGLLNFDCFCSWLQTDLSARELFPKLVARLHDDPSVASMVTDRIWLGGIQASKDAVFFKTAGISHVLNVSHDLENAFERGDDAGLREIRYFRIPIEDQIGEDVLSKVNWLGLAASWMQAALNKSDARLLIHCGLGVSRSSTFLMAFLMHADRLNVSQALHKIRAARPFAGPGAGFMEQLLRLEQKWVLVDTVAGSLELWSYMEAESADSWAAQYSSKRKWFPWGVTCPWCHERHSDYDTDSCQHCGKSLLKFRIPCV